MSSKVIAWISSLALGAVLIGGGVWWFTGRATAEEPTWLFSHTADGGTLEEQSDGSYLLTLTGIDPHVMAFTDRPVRDTQIFGIQALADGWNELFESSPPNAVLVEHNAQGEADSVVLVLSNPQVSGDELTFSAQMLTDEAAAEATSLEGTLHSAAPASFEEVSVFIDDVSNTLVYASTFIPFDSSF